MVQGLSGTLNARIIDQIGDMIATRRQRRRQFIDRFFLGDIQRIEADHIAAACRQRVAPGFKILRPAVRGDDLYAHGAEFFRHGGAQSAQPACYNRMASAHIFSPLLALIILLPR